MSQILLRAAVSLLALTVGLAVYQIYRIVLFSSGKAEQVEPLSVEGWDSSPPLRLSIFIGVEGITFSADAGKFNLYDAYKDHEATVLVSQDELSDIAGRLIAAGLLQEAEINSPVIINLPQSYTITLAWPDRTREFTWTVRDGCRVPEKYLSILDEVSNRHQVPLIRRFSNHNRPELFPNEAAA